MVVFFAGFCHSDEMKKKTNIHLFYELASKVLTEEASKNEKQAFEEYLKNPEYKDTYEWLRDEWQKELKIQSDAFNLERGVAQLRQKIKQSDERVANERKTVRLRRIFQSTAAILILLISIRIVFSQLYSEPEIAKFAATNPCDVKNGDTRLILENQYEVVIESDDSEIDYTSGKGKIIINDKDSKEQIVAESGTVYNTVVVPYGKRSKIVLSDRSEVWLNSGSRLVYPAEFGKGKREVFLEGEALFEVHHNTAKPFVVLTNDIEVEVLGTIFNLSAYPDDRFTETVLERGSVAIGNKNDKLLKHSSVQITPGTLARYNPESNKITREQVNTELYTSWRNGYLLYEQEPLSSIVKKLSRYYVCEIQFSERLLGNETFSGKLELKDDIQNVLETIAFVSSLQIEKKNNVLTLKN